MQLEIAFYSLRRWKIAVVQDEMVQYLVSWRVGTLWMALTRLGSAWSLQTKTHVKFPTTSWTRNLVWGGGRNNAESRNAVLLCLWQFSEMWALYSAVAFPSASSSNCETDKPSARLAESALKHEKKKLKAIGAVQSCWNPASVLEKSFGSARLSVNACQFSPFCFPIADFEKPLWSNHSFIKKMRSASAFIRKFANET